MAKHNIDITEQKKYLFETFVNDIYTIEAVNLIVEKQQSIMANWQIKTRIDDIIHQTLLLPNGTVNKPYFVKIDFDMLGWNDVVFTEIKGLDNTGLDYDADQKIISGTPIQNGDLKLKLLFLIESDATNPVLNEKVITLIINPDPKSLWKNIPSKTEAEYWKEDNVAVAEKFLDKHIVVASKRGRSHGNVGSFRDDDFMFKMIGDTGWGVVAVSDGAGSASFSRQGSKLACSAVVTYFETNFTSTYLKGFDELLFEHYNNTNEESPKMISHFVYNNLSKASHYAYSQIDDFATQNGLATKEFHATLIFMLVKKYDFGYVVLTFGVGDCPIAILNKDLSDIKLMNWLDVGDYGGGTRFITMPEIFQSDKFSTRFGFKLIDDFGYIMLMTDGIYDPKFEVEANLERIEKWKGFIEDLKGTNDDGVGVVFDENNSDIAQQLSNWMDFWSPGNHDDRTLAIIY